ncbi:MAG: PfkB family carbohydrate kinase [Chloroflexi bacterium]|nr:PfkB family carbohydrate kinase [Chloroflexota bacterium]
MTPTPSSPSFVAIGHLSFDVNIVDNGPPSHHIPGGAAAYAGLTASKHGLSAGILTSVDSDYPVKEVLGGVDIHVVESEHTATFANYYDSGERSQVLLASGSKIPKAALPANWAEPEILFAGPLLHELPTDCVSWFRPGLSCIVPSGWLRRWGPDGVITHADRLPSSLARARGRKWDVVVVSEAEIRDLPEQQLFDLGEIVCVTRGALGARIGRAKNAWLETPALAATPTDLTGAGDIWAAAFVIALSEQESLEDAGRYASAASAVAIESEGLAGCPSREEVIERLSRD